MMRSWTTSARHRVLTREKKRRLAARNTSLYLRSRLRPNEDTTCSISTCWSQITGSTKRWMDGWMECDRVSMCGHDSGRGEVSRSAIQVVVNHLLMRPPVIPRGRCVRKASSGDRDAAAVTSPAAAKNTREDSGRAREELRGREMDLAECGGKQMIGQLTQLSGSGWK